MAPRPATAGVVAGPRLDVIVLLVTGTPAGLPAQAGPVSGSVNVFAAASLTDAFAAIGKELPQLEELARAARCAN